MIDLIKHYILSIGVPRPKAVYPMNGITRGKEITPNRNRPGIFRDTKFDTGPDRLPAGSMRFKGKRNSYMLIPNRRRLDFKNSMTVLMWVKPWPQNLPVLASISLGLMSNRTSKTLILTYR